MQFNRRVLEEAGDPANPLLERVKFLAITGSNLDEYVATGSPATIACAPTNP
jgi:polyphosphate kinase